MPQNEYQNIGTPCFYVDYFQWALVTGIAKNDGIGGNNIFGAANNGASKLFGASGNVTPPDVGDIEKLFHLDPTNQYEITMPANPNSNRQLSVNTYFESEEAFNLNYFMVLNHNLKDAGVSTYHEGFGSDDGGTYQYANLANLTENVNFNGRSDPPDFNGWLAVKNSKSNSGWVTNNQSYNWWENIQITLKTPVDTLAIKKPKIGALSVGTKYTMPHSPDMELTLEKQFGGITRQETKGGKLLTNMTYGHAPLWTSEPWGLYEDLPSNLNARRMGRRVWNLNFSHVADSDLMAQTEMLNFNGIEDSSGYTPYLSSNAFLPQFAQKTLNGTLKFIFQPDSTDNSPDGFAICTLDQNGIQMRQSSHKTYDISLKIREVW